MFSLLWFYALQFYFKRVSRKKLFVVVVLMAFVFGIAIELFQTFLTTSRSGDVIDVVANTAGSLLAILLIRFLGKNLFLNKIQE